MAIRPNVLKQFETTDAGHDYSDGKPNLFGISQGEKVTCSKKCHGTLEIHGHR